MKICASTIAALVLVSSIVSMRSVEAAPNCRRVYATQSNYNTVQLTLVERVDRKTIEKDFYGKENVHRALLGIADAARSGALSVKLLQQIRQNFTISKTLVSLLVFKDSLEAKKIEILANLLPDLRIVRQTEEFYLFEGAVRSEKEVEKLGELVLSSPLKPMAFFTEADLSPTNHLFKIPDSAIARIRTQTLGDRVLLNAEALILQQMRTGFFSIDAAKALLNFAGPPLTLNLFISKARIEEAKKHYPEDYAGTVDDIVNRGLRSLQIERVAQRQSESAETILFTFQIDSQDQAQGLANLTNSIARGQLSLAVSP